MAKLLIVLVATLCATLCASGLPYLQRVLHLEESEKLPALDGTEIGYDHHDDRFYLNDEAVSQEFARSKFVDTHVSLAGQHVDTKGRTVERSVYPFAVGQKAMEAEGSSTDRWDAKSWDLDRYDSGIQFFGLFHGHFNELLANKLRARLLSNVANSVKDVLVVLDRMASDPSSNPSVVELVKKEAKRAIGQTFVQLDKSIRADLKDGDDASASASVVILTRMFLITANVGQGKIIAHDSLGNSHELSLPVDQEDESQLASVRLFGSKDSKDSLSEPTVNVLEREFEVSREADESAEADESEHSAPAKYQFLIVASPSVGQLVPAGEAVEIVESLVNQYNNDIRHEQALYTGAVTRILDEATIGISMYGRRNQMDHAVMVIGLDPSYQNMHHAV